MIHLFEIDFRSRNRLAINVTVSTKESQQSILLHEYKGTTEELIYLINPSQYKIERTEKTEAICYMQFSMLNFPLHFQSVEEIWKSSDRYSNHQSKLVVNSAIIYIMNAIWFARNQIRLKNKNIPWKSSIASITAFVSLAGNISKAVSKTSYLFGNNRGVYLFNQSMPIQNRKNKNTEICYMDPFPLSMHNCQT